MEQKGLTAFFLFLLACPTVSLAQLRIDNLPCTRSFPVVCDDSVCHAIIIYDNVCWLDSIYSAPLEYHEPGIISQRSYLVSGPNKYMLDSLIIKNYHEYCLALDVSRVFPIQNGEQKYLIIECYDTFSYGTDQQPLFIVLIKKDNWYSISSVYIMSDYSDEEYEKISIRYDENGISMIGGGVSLINL